METEFGWENIIKPVWIAPEPQITAKKNNITELTVEDELDYANLEGDPNAIDEIIKQELALKIAREMINEDLIQILVSDDISKRTKVFRAQVKFVQE